MKKTKAISVKQEQIDDIIDNLYDVQLQIEDIQNSTISDLQLVQESISQLLQEQIDTIQSLSPNSKRKTKQRHKYSLDSYVVSQADINCKKWSTHTTTGSYAYLIHNEIDVPFDEYYQTVLDRIKDKLGITHECVIMRYTTIGDRGTGPMQYKAFDSNNNSLVNPEQVWKDVRNTFFRLS